MKTNLLPILIWLTGIQCLHAGQSQLFPINGLNLIPCCGIAEYSIDVKNVNPTFAIENISGRWVVTRQQAVIHQQIDYPRIQDLQPNTTTTFVLEIPMELLLLDGLIDIFFEFNSDFDLNQDPTRTRNAEVTGCGMTKEEVTEVIRDEFISTAEQRDAYIFLFSQLLKPGSIIRGSNRDGYVNTVAAFTWLSIIYNPFMRFEQPVTVLLTDANTAETTVIDANWPPIIFDEIYVPEINSTDQITGETYIYNPSPVSFDYTPVSSMPMDSVCAILVAGIDVTKPNMQESFDKDLELMKGYLTEHQNGPRLPASSVLLRQVKNGYHGDSLLMDLANLQNKYNKVYFYYTGHGSETGELCLGQFGLDWLDYTRFTTDLLNCGAESFCIMVDACYSGALIDAICAHPNVENLDIEVIASSNSVKTSRSEAFGNEGVNDWYGKYTSQFFWTVQHAANDKNRNGKVSFVEGFKTVMMNNYAGIEELQSPLLKDIKNKTVARYGNAVKKSAELLFGTFPVSNATISIFPSSQGPGTPVISFDQSYGATLEEISYVGWIDWNPNALLPKPISFAYVKEETDSVTFAAYNYTWPTLPLCPGYNPCDPESVFAAGIDYLTGQPLNSISTQAQNPPPRDSTKIAVVVTGQHPDALVQNVIDQSAYLFALDLQNEEYGDAFAEEDISFQPYVAVTTLDSYLESLQGKSTVYFYYTGNMSLDGTLHLGSDPSEWMPMDQLLNNIAAIGANDNKIFLDASNSGIAVDWLKINNPFGLRNVDVFTASNNQSPAYFKVWVDDQMNMTGSATAFTYHLLQSYGDNAINNDGYEGVSFKESFNALFIKNPTKQNNLPLFQVSQPLNISYRNIVTGGNAVGAHDFKGIDVELILEERASEVNVNLYQELNSRAQTTPSSDVYEISPARQWKMNGILDVDMAFRADLIFSYRDNMDVLSGSEGVIGLVSRISPDEDWEAYYPADYNEFTQTITARDVSELREWAIARVREPVGLHEQPQGLSAMSVFPNPVIDQLTLAFELIKPSRLEIEILDLNGNTLVNHAPKLFDAGKNNVILSQADSIPGLYIVKISDGVGEKTVPFVVR